MWSIPTALQEKATIPLWPDCGEMLGLSRNATYRAAHRGEIPILRFGSRMVVPVPALIAVLGGAHDTDPASGAQRDSSTPAA